MQALLNAVRLAFSRHKPVLLMDRFDRENEADLVFPAELMTPVVMNFIIRNSSGIVCLSLSRERARKLGLRPMLPSRQVTNRFRTPFAISIEAAKGVTTGVSAKDRTTTILAAMHPNAKPEDLARPGHVFPLLAHPKGLAGREGHTEGSVELVKACGYQDAAVICELMNADGSMARLKEAEEFAKLNATEIVTIEALLGRH